MELLFWMVVMHFVADFGLQSAWMALNKGKHFLVLFAHAVIWTGLVLVPMAIFNEINGFQVVWLCAGHILADKLKFVVVSELGYYENHEDKDLAKTVWQVVALDQLFHLIQILTVWSLV